MKSGKNLYKIGMFIPHVGDGGDWTALRTMCAGLHKQGHRLWLGTANHQGRSMEIFEDSIELEIHRGLKGIIRSIRKQRGEFPKDLDVLHGHSPSSLLFILLLRRFHCNKAKVVMTYHWQTPDSWVSRALKSWLFQKADCLHLNSVDTEHYMREFYRQDERHIEFVPLGTEDHLFPLGSVEEKKKLKKFFKLPADALVLIFAGRHNPEKNIPLILNFMLGNHRQFPNLHLILTGGGPCRAANEELIKGTGAESQVHFLGRVPDIRDAYCAADLLLLTSTDLETFGLVCVEAGLCGVPILRSDIAGANDQIVEGVNGWVYPKNQPGAFHETLVKLLSAPELLRPAGLEARRIFLERFSLEKTTRGMERMYDRMVHPSN